MKVEAGKVWDSKGIPIYPGDLLKSYHFTARLRRKRYYLYHTVVNQKGYLYMISTSSLEPSKANEGGSCLLSQDLANNAEIISGYGPEPYLDYTDRPKRKVMEM